MPLDPAKIKELQAKNEAKKNKPKQTRTGRRSSKIDPNDRSHKAWFALEHHLLSDSQEPVYCDNPDCIDPRDKLHGQVVVELEGKRLCRFCFIEGWLVDNPEQQSLAVNSSQQEQQQRQTG